MFKKGTYKFNEDANFNFQLNRVVMWGNGDPDEIKSVAKGITDSASWVSIRDIDLLTIGMVNEMFIENQNDDVADKVYKVQASQHDFDMF